MPHFLDYLLPALSKYASRTLLKLYTGTQDAPSWTNISYEQFQNDMERVARYWMEPLRMAGLEEKTVIGLWITGEKYTDLVSMYAIARIGYIPQMLNKAMANRIQPVVQDVLAATKGKAVLYDPYFADYLEPLLAQGVACMELADISTIANAEDELPPPPVVGDDEIGVIFHTSGTTSGIPKPVPEMHKWLRCQAQIQWPAIWQGGEGQAVVNNLGSFANVGSATTISYLGWSGHCLVQTSKPDIDAHEFVAMVEDGLNFVLLYAPWLSKLINVARTDDRVLKTLKGMKQVSYTGAALNPEDEQWLIENGVKATVIYATTEAGGCFVSDISSTSQLPSMHVIPGIKCQLIPTSGIKDKSELDSDSSRRQGGTGMLFDCFLPADADNCPHPSIRNRPDGHITGDLFELTSEGLYAFRGRNDDWIRTGKHNSFCDTKSIEDSILQTCADLVQNCVVVGHYRPGVVLFVEPAAGYPLDESVLENTADTSEAVVGLKKKILERHAAFNGRLFVHERINELYQVVVLPRGRLPRTMEKGNIRRKATEDQNAQVLEKIYEKLKSQWTY
ncbi:hypothetical protein D9613_001287 [Agrocybe pediades]|uniref:AMP-dependent synthetase/ligase domain-containing protein n=1 Tax=Agrocybe pediades TaxID=84607 RepID=A0A8H4R5G9_9AGAR|nr:hypothetical protein D9613_001287 [Agrocybe pediades]